MVPKAVAVLQAVVQAPQALEQLMVPKAVAVLQAVVQVIPVVEVGDDRIVSQEELLVVWIA
jgi:hypothetical protein